MEANCTKLTERILQLTLEIIYLLTGEDNIFVKKTSGDEQNFIMVPLHFLLIPKRNNKKTVLEVTKKIVELLTGEVPIRCQDVTVYFSMEEWEYLEGHKELYKDVMMASQPALTSPDGSSNGNPPERCPCPLYSWDSTQDFTQEPTISHHDHGEQVVGMKTKTNKEKYVRPEQLSMKEAEMTVTFKKEESPLHVSSDGSSNGNPPERCPRPLYSRDSTHEDLSIPHHHQEEQVIGMKTKTNKEEKYVRIDQLSMNEDEMTVTFKKEEFSLRVISGGHNGAEAPEGRLILSEQSNKDDNGMAQCSPGDCEKHEPVVLLRIPTGDKYFSCSECRMSFIHKSRLVQHLRVHTGERPFLCSVCRKSFARKSQLSKHQNVHTGQKPFSCPECDKCFSDKEKRKRHMRVHTGEKPFSCSECERCFSSKGNLDQHLRSHTGEKPYFCLECGKCFSYKMALDVHRRTNHTGEKPYACPECGRCFNDKRNCIRHMRTHTGEKPFSCSECGRCFADRGNRDKHMKTHTVEKPFSCSKCRQCFAHKLALDVHQSTHTTENTYSCPKCSRNFIHKKNCIRHIRTHNNEKPFSCSECGKCFAQKGTLAKHMRMHTTSGQ